MRIIADENMSFPREAFSEFGEVILLPGREICNQDLVDAEVLLVRSITNVNEGLLKNTSVKFVGTATIGTDHIDKNYLKTARIEFSDAAGCNSFAVTEYVLTAAAKYLKSAGKTISGMKLGIVGHGNIGTKVEIWAKALGFDVVINDPPKQRANPGIHYSTLEEALKCDIVTFHVPLINEGVDKTVHLLDQDKLSLLKPGALLINSSRGPVVDNSALLRRIKESSDLFTVLDVWENEPRLNAELLQAVNFGTPHIAGYTLEGKVNGTTILYNALCKFIGREGTWQPPLPVVENDSIEIDDPAPEKLISNITEHVYNIGNDYKSLLEAVDLEESARGKYFDDLRKNYSLRRELNNYTANTKGNDSRTEQILRALRLNF